MTDQGKTPQAEGERLADLIYSVIEVLERKSANYEEIFMVATYLLSDLSVQMPDEEYSEFVTDVKSAMTDLRSELKLEDSR
jgi:hypothetical protein